MESVASNPVEASHSLCSCSLRISVNNETHRRISKNVEEVQKASLCYGFNVQRSRQLEKVKRNLVSQSSSEVSIKDAGAMNFEMTENACMENSAFIEEVKEHGERDKGRTKGTRRILKTNARTELKTASEVLRMEAAIAGIERKAKGAILGDGGKTYNKNLYPKTILEALTDRIHKMNWQSALSIFHLLREQNWYKPKPETYLKLLVMMGRCRQTGEAYKLFKTMLEEGCEPTVQIYTALLAAYGTNGLLEKAFAVLDDMKSIPHCQPNIFTYNICIKSCIRYGHFHCVNRLVTEMMSYGIMPNIVTYNTLVDGYGKAGMLNDIEKIINHMFENDECKPDICTMNSALKAFGDNGKIDKMERWYQKFYDADILPDTTTFNIMVSTYGKQCLFDKMSIVLENMRRSFCSWTTVTYNSVIDAYGKEGKIVSMESYYRLMISEGIKPTAVTFCSLVSAYGKVGHVYKVSKAIRQIENSDIIPDTAFFNAVITAYGKAANYAEMEKTFRLMERWGCKPNSRTLGIMMKAYSNGNMPHKVNELKQHCSKNAW